MTDHANCDDAKHTLYEFLDGELTPEKRSDIQAHLENCSPCFEAFDFEAELLTVVRKKCVEQVPEGLQAKIAAALQIDPDSPLHS
ncbi:MAG: mycothiol system anti-sigma-R factor [Acidimicrobiales bacterium]|nr:mycothiol system anti-sigma-R factor [Acidimicrobiales bacterium]